MIKKNKKDKILNQNLRNKINNRIYISHFKILLKKFKNELIKINTIENYEFNEKSFSKISNLLESKLDKSVKKNIFHKNTINRKKSKIKNLLSKIFISF